MSVIKSINSFAKSFNNSVDGFFRGVLTRNAFSASTSASPLQGMVFGDSKPKWITLSSRNTSNKPQGLTLFLILGLHYYQGL